MFVTPNDRHAAQPNQCGIITPPGVMARLEPLFNDIGLVYQQLTTSDDLDHVILEDSGHLFPLLDDMMRQIKTILAQGESDILYLYDAGSYQVQTVVKSRRQKRPQPIGSLSWL